MLINYWIGQFLERFGYRVLQRGKWHEDNCDLIELGFLLVAKLKPDDDIRVLQVGAFDGQLADPLQRIVNCSRSRCVLVEPQPEPYQLLQQRYGANPSISLVNTAITERDGSVSFFVPSSGASPMASIDPGHHKKFGLKSSSVREISVQSMTPLTLLKHCQLDRIDLLQVDTEGLDARLICLFLEAGIKPAIINFESLHCPWPDWARLRELLLKNRYRWIKGSQDTFAVNEIFLSQGFAGIKA